VEEIKHAIRMKHASQNGKPDGTLIPVGSLSPDLVRKMGEARSVDELVSLLGGTPYGEALSGALPKYQELEIPLPLELALDRFTFGELEAALLLIDAEHLRPAQEFVGTYVDITNIRILLRAKRDLLDAETVAEHLLPGGPRLSTPALKIMAESKTLQELLGDLEALQLHAAINEAIPSSGRTGSLISLEAALDLYLLETVLDLSTIYRYGPGPLIRFLVARKIEIKNLGIILRGIEGTVPDGTIRGLTVRERVRG
jgi:V/A-type H+-transporting ATPase subunit C